VIFGSRPDHRYTRYTLQLAELITKKLEFERNVYWAWDGGYSATMGGTDLKALRSRH